MADDVDSTRRRRYGPEPLAASERRVHTVSVRLNAAELAQLDSQRDAVQMQRGEYLRAAALHRLPPTIPEVNRAAWAALARSAANLNQIAHKLNMGDSVPLADVRTTVEAFRLDLLGAMFDAEEGDQ